MLLLPRGDKEPARDFGLLRMETSRNKALDLGPAFVFDYDPVNIILTDNDIGEDAGSLLILESQLMLVTRIGGTHEPSLIYVDVKQGTTVDDVPRASCVEIRSWRLLLNSELADTPPRELICWP